MSALSPVNTEKYKVISPSASPSVYTHTQQLKQVAAAFICARAEENTFFQEPAAIQPLTPSLLRHKFHARCYQRLQMHRAPMTPNFQIILCVWPEMLTLHFLPLSPYSNETDKQRNIAAEAGLIWTNLSTQVFYKLLFLKLI